MIGMRMIHADNVEACLCGGFLGGAVVVGTYHVSIIAAILITVHCRQGSVYDVPTGFGSAEQKSATFLRVGVFAVTAYVFNTLSRNGHRALVKGCRARRTSCSVRMANVVLSVLAHLVLDEHVRSPKTNR